jgi:hypothetical protein
MSTYLSIDIDFWNKNRNYEHLRKFLELAKGCAYNISIVDSHEQLKDHVNRSGCNNLINVDYHSDIYDVKTPRYHDFLEDHSERVYNCGTWVNFVKFRYKGRFTWIHPHIHDRGIQYGYCHVETKKNFLNVNPFFNPKIAEWDNAIKIASKNPEDNIDWNNIGAVGIAFSYAWLRDGIHDKIVCIAKNVFGKRPALNKRALLH